MKKVLTIFAVLLIASTALILSGCFGRSDVNPYQERYNTLRGELTALTQRLEGYQATHANHLNTIESLDNKLGVVSAQVTNLQGLNLNLANQIVGFQDTIADLEAKIDDKDIESEELLQSLNGLRGQMALLQGQIETNQGTIEDLLDEVDVLQCQLTYYQDALEDLMLNGFANLMTQIAELTADLEYYQGKAGDTVALLAQVAALQAQIDELLEGGGGFNPTAMDGKFELQFVVAPGGSSHQQGSGTFVAIVSSGGATIEFVSLNFNGQNVQAIQAWTLISNGAINAGVGGGGVNFMGAATNMLITFCIPSDEWVLRSLLTFEGWNGGVTVFATTIISQTFTWLDRG